MRSDNIQRHMNVCAKNGGLGIDKVQIEQSMKKPCSHGTVATIFPEKREKPVDSLYSKTLNPKISALIDDIVNEQSPEKIQRKGLVENNTDGERQHYSDMLDSTPRVVTDENEDDEDENDDDKDDGDEDEDFDHLFSKKKSKNYNKQNYSIRM